MIASVAEANACPQYTRIPPQNGGLFPIVRSMAHNRFMHEIAEILGLRPHDLRRIVVAVSLILAILAFGVIGYSILAELSLPDALYMTMITISTVGFTEIGEFDSTTRCSLPS